MGISIKIQHFGFHNSKSHLQSNLNINYILPNLISSFIGIPEDFDFFSYMDRLVNLILFLNLRYGAGNWKLSNSMVKGESHLLDKDYILKSIKPNERFNCFEDTIDNHFDLNSTYAVIGWPDSYPPPFMFLQTIIDEIDFFLKSNRDHIYVVESQMDNRRSKILCVAYLMKHHQMPLKEGMLKFTGCTSAKKYKRNNFTTSQNRYMKYHELFLSYGISDRKMITKCHQISRPSIIGIFIVNSPEFIKLSKESTFIKIQCYDQNRKLKKVADLEIDNNLLTDDLNDTNIPNLHKKIELEEYDFKLEFSLRQSKWDRFKAEPPSKPLLWCFINAYFERLSTYPKHIINENHIIDNFEIILEWNDFDRNFGWRNKHVQLFESIKIIISNENKLLPI